MKRFLTLIVATVLLAGCGGGASGSTASTPQVKPQSRTVVGSVVISIPTGSTPASAARARFPQFVSPNAESVAVNVNGGSDTLFDISATSSLCATVAGTRNCTLSFTAPVGSDSFGFLVFAGPNGAGTQLASAGTTQTIVAGTAFNFTVALNAAIGTMIITIVPVQVPGSCPNSLQNNSTINEGCSGTATVSVAVDDPSGAQITGSAAFAGNGISFTANDPSLTIAPAQITSPTQTAVVTYNGTPFAAAITNQAVITGTAGGQTAQASFPVRRSYLYVANSNDQLGGTPSGNGDIAVFTYGSAGPVSPVRVIQGNLTGISDPMVPLVDDAGNLIVLDGGASGTNPVIDIFAPGAGAGTNNNVAPIKQITNITAVTGGQPCQGMTFDPTRTFVVLTCNTSLYVFPETANGTASSALTATLTSTSLSFPTGLAFDLGGNLYVADASTFAIFYFSGPIPTSGGVHNLGVAGSQLNSGSAFPGGLTPISLRVDNSGTLYSAIFFLSSSSGPADAQNEIGIWRGNFPCASCAPSATLTGTPFTTHATAGLTFDPKGNMYTVNPFTNLITVFSHATVTGPSVANPTPLLTLDDESAPGLGALGMTVGP